MAELVKLNSAEIANLLRGPEGPVVRHLTVLATKVQVRAKQLVGVKTGNLRATIVKRFAREGGEVTVWIGSEMPYTFYHHEGTVAHVIPAKRAQMLRFADSTTGEWVFRKQVFHPGTKPNRFLLKAVQEIVPRG